MFTSAETNSYVLTRTYYLWNQTNQYSERNKQDLSRAISHTIEMEIRADDILN